MENPKLVAIGDNVCDKYLSRGRMYPGGQCVNISVFAHMNGIRTAYLGKFGDDTVADTVKAALDYFNVDRSRCREYPGENGFACVTLDGNDRVFLGSNKGGIAKEHPFDFTQEDLDYVKGFDLICTNLNAYIETDLPTLKATGVPVAFDFSTRWNDSYLRQVCPNVDIAVLSCAHLSATERETEMRKVADHGVPLVLGTIGEDGSWLLHEDRFLHMGSECNGHAIDTMGAGDAYFSAFVSSLLKRLPHGTRFTGIPDDVLLEAMHEGAVFAAQVCGLEGAFGHGVPITGRIIDRPNL